MYVNNFGIFYLYRIAQQLPKSRIIEAYNYVVIIDKSMYIASWL